MSAEKSEPWVIVENEGNEMMKTMWRSLAQLDKAQKERLAKPEKRGLTTDLALFRYCFKDHSRIKVTTSMRQASKRILAIATVNLFFNPQQFFSPEVKLMALYEALAEDFKREEFDKVYSLVKPECDKKHDESLKESLAKSECDKKVECDQESGEEHHDVLKESLAGYKALYHKALLKEKYEQTRAEPWVIIERDGTGLMKDMLKEITESPQKYFRGYKGPSLDFSKLTPAGKLTTVKRCFPYAQEVYGTYGGEISSETILAIATVNLFFDTNFVFAPEVSLQSFHDALTQDFEIEGSKAKLNDCKLLNATKLLAEGGEMGHTKDKLASELRKYFCLLKEPWRRSMSPHRFFRQRN